MYNDDDYSVDRNGNTTYKTAARPAQKVEMYRRQHRVNSISEIPPGTNVLAIEESSQTIDSGYGDRGQPDYITQTIQTLWRFDDEEAMIDWITKAHDQKKKYRVISVTPHEVSIQIKVDVSVKK